MSGVLVTGGAGFIGSHVAEALLAGGEDVVVLDNFNDAYDPKTAVPALMARLNEPGFVPEVAPAVQSAVIEEWEMGTASSLQELIEKTLGAKTTRAGAG